MKRKLLYFTFFFLICPTFPLPVTAQIINIPEPVPPPPTVRDAFELDPFYQQWIDFEGLPVVASEKVNPYALKEAVWLLRRIIGHRPDVLQTIVEKKVRFTVIGYSEMTTDIPEYSHLRPAFYWDRRVRGLGASGLPVPAVSCTEENLLAYPGDTAGTASQLIHEFSHVVHKFGLRAIDPTFDNRLKIAYDAAMEQGLWQGTYSARDEGEYWARGAWFFFNGRIKGYTSQAVSTWRELQNYDPALAALLIEIYGDSEWVYTPIETRTNLPHLQGFNPQDSPAFEWPQELEEAYAQLKDPNINGGDEWVNLDLYDPSLASQFSTPETLGNRTLVIFANLLAFDVLVYHLQSEGRETLKRRFPANLWHLQTFGAHAGGIFIIRAVNGNPLAVFQAAETTGRVLIGPATVVIIPGLSKVSGDNQSNLSGAILADPFVIELRDENGSGLEGISVTFTVVAGDGTLSVTHTMTDENGQAESTFTLGPNLGTNTVEVSAVGIEQTVIFNAVAEAAVNIPDSNLRAVIEAALNKEEGAPIVPREMATLPRLKVPEAGIRNLTGLEHATNLTYLDFWKSSVSDISPVAGLINLTHLGFAANNAISDVSALAGLTKLTALWVNGNSISDISPLAGLTQLSHLGLGSNNISDVPALAGLTNLTLLRLNYNSISDLSPLASNTGLGSGDEIYVKRNPLSYLSLHTHIPALQSRGVTVEFDNRAHPALLKISGDNQKGASFVSLPQPFVIEAQDENGSALAGISVRFAVTSGGGAINTTITRTDETGRAQSTLMLGPNLGTNTVKVYAAGIESTVTFYAISDTEAPPITADVNGDSSVNILDLILIASSLGQSGQNNADVNRDGVISILDLVLAAGMFDEAAAAPSAHAQVPEALTAVEVQGWLTNARSLEVRDPIMKRGFVVLEQLLVSLTPTETELLENYPNPFNPETWIPYRLAEDAFVTLTIYDLSGQIIRTLEIGHQIASAYENRSKAIYWNGRNGLGEQVTSGVYFYTLTAGDYSATQKMLILK